MKPSAPPIRYKISHESDGVSNVIIETNVKGKDNIIWSREFYHPEQAEIHCAQSFADNGIEIAWSEIVIDGTTLKVSQWAKSSALSQEKKPLAAVP